MEVEGNLGIAVRIFGNWLNEGMMKSFDVYRNQSSSKVEAVKTGFSWPGFFFGFAWCFAKGLIGKGIILLVVVVSAAIGLGAMGIYFKDFDMASSISDWIVFGLALYVGWAGNAWRSAMLVKKGYTKITTIEARSTSEAIEKATTI